jgi:hypothetical protein
VAFKPLSSRLNDLPDVLVGPLLRLVKEDQVSVFLAFKAATKVTLEVFSSETNGVGVDRKMDGTRSTVPLGPLASVKLHVVCVTATGAALLDPGATYVYDVKLGAADGDDSTAAPAGRSLFSNDVIRESGEAGRQLLTYPGGPKLPSFVVPPGDVDDLRLLHASCRKPHGNGPDALAIGDTILARSITSPDRPHQLFLGGDQIYADDVPAVLLFMLQDAATALGMVVEQLPVKGSGTKTGAQLHPDARAEIVKEDAGFTSDDADSHLLTFADYALMYAFAWSDVLWPEKLEDIPGFMTALPTEWQEREDDILANQTAAQPKRPRHQKTAGRIRDERPHLDAYYGALPAVRRLLANVPTLMVFDDHEITDDWNLNLEWIRRTQDPAKAVPTEDKVPTALARSVLRNGLVAYAIFQAWGNTPGQFKLATDPGTKLLAAIGPWTGGNTGTEIAALTTAVGLPSAIGDHVAIANPGALEWHYRQVWAAHELIVLDTRTRRGAVKAGEEGGPPALIYEQADFDAMLPVDPVPAPMPLVLVIAPAPMFGVPIHEAVARFLGQRFLLGAGADPEHWALTPHARERVLGALLARGPVDTGNVVRSRVVVLSGDVHHGSAIHVRYRARKPLGRPGRTVEAVLAQLTSSALKNQETKTFLIEALGFFTLDSRLTGIVGLDMPVTEVSGWENAADGELEVGRERYDPTSTPSWPVVIKGQPALHEFTYGVPFAVPPNQPSPTMYELDEDPEWCYVVRPARGVRENRPPLPLPAASAAPTGRTDQVLLAATVHRSYAVATGRGQEVVGHNNIGDVTFHWGAGDDKSVTQKLWWLSGGETDPQPRTTWVIDLGIGSP